MNATFLISVAFGLFSVMVRTEAALVCIVAGVNPFVAEAEAKTVSVSVSAPPVPALVEVTDPVLLA